MDSVVGNNGGLKTNLALGAKRSEFCINDSLTLNAFDSSKDAKTRASSNDSVYEVIAESDIEDLENEVFRDVEDNHENCNGVLNPPHSPHETNYKKVNDLSELVKMDEEFVIVDDDACVNEEDTDSIEPQKSPDDEQQCLLDGDDLEVFEEVAEDEEKDSDLRHTSDNDGEIESELEEVAATGSECDTTLSEEDDRMKGLLKELRENVSVEDISSNKQNKSIKSDSFITPGSKNEKIDQNSSSLCNFKTDESSVAGTVNNNDNHVLNKQTRCSTQNVNTGCSESTVSTTVNNENNDVMCDIEDDISDNFIEIEDSVKETDRNIVCKENDDSKILRLSFTSSEEDNIDFEDMILDIIDETSQDKQENDIPVFESTQDNSNVSHNGLESLSSIVESSCISKVHSIESEVKSENVTNNLVKNIDCGAKESISEFDTSVSIKPLTDDSLNNDEVVSNSCNVNQSFSTNSELQCNININKDTHSEFSMKIDSMEMPVIKASENKKVQALSDCDNVDSKKITTVDMLLSTKENAHSDSHIKNDSVKTSIIETSMNTKVETQSNCDIKFESILTPIIGLLDSIKEKVHDNIKNDSTNTSTIAIPEGKKLHAHSNCDIGSGKTSATDLLDSTREEVHSDSDIKNGFAETSVETQSNCDVKVDSVQTSRIDKSDTTKEKIHSDSDVKMDSLEASVIEVLISMKEKVHSDSDVKIDCVDISTIEVSDSTKEKMHFDCDVKTDSIETSTVEMSDNTKEKIHSDCDVKRDSVETSIVEMLDIYQERVRSDSDVKKDSVGMSDSSNVHSDCDVKNDSVEASTIEMSDSMKEKINSDYDVKMDSSETSTVELQTSTIEMSDSTKEIIHSDCDVKMDSSETSTIEMSDSTKEIVHSDCDVKMDSAETSIVELLKSSKIEAYSEPNIKIDSKETSTAEMTGRIKMKVEYDCDTEMKSSEMTAVTTIEDTHSELEMKIVSSEMSTAGISEKTYSEPNIQIVSSELSTKGVSEDAHSESSMKIVSSETPTIDTPEDTHSDSSIKVILSEMPTVNTQDAHSESNVKIISSDIPTKGISEDCHSESNVKIVSTSDKPAEGRTNDSHSESKIEIASSGVPTEKISEVTHSESSTKIVSSEIHTVDTSGNKVDNTNSESSIKSVSSHIHTSESKVDNTHSDSDIEVVDLETSAETHSESEIKNIHIETSVAEKPDKILIAGQDGIASETQTKSRDISEGNMDWTFSCTTAEAQLTEPESSVNESQLLVDTLCKRKLEDIQNDVQIKKLKGDNEENKKIPILNGFDILTSLKNVQQINSNSIVFQNQVTEKIRGFCSGKMEIVIPRKDLDEIASMIFQLTVQDHYMKDFNSAISFRDEILRKKGILNMRFESQYAEYSNCRMIQRRKFEACKYNKIVTRTVGVNVKIIKERDILASMCDENKNLLPLVKSEPVQAMISTDGEKNTVVPKEESTSTRKTEDRNIPNPLQESKPKESASTQKTEERNIPNPLQSVTTSRIAFPNDTTISPIVTSQSVATSRIAFPKDTTISPIVTSQIQTTNRFSPSTTVTGPLSQKIKAPNVTVSGNPLLSLKRPPTTHSLLLVPSSSFTSLANCKEGNKLFGTTGVPTLPASDLKVTMPGMPNTSNVVIPIMDYLQLLSSGSRDSAAIQPSIVPRPTVPPLPSSITRAGTFAYIMPQNSAIGPRGILQSPNQQFQFFVRVTNPGTTTAANPVVYTTTPVVPQSSISSASRPSSSLVMFSTTAKHPPPLPKSPTYTDIKGKSLPPKPSLKCSKNANGIVLSWNMCLFSYHATISFYQLFAYQESNGPVTSAIWKKVGDVNALPLPMACTLTQFVDKNRYHFTVRAVDEHQRFGPFSDPVNILYEKESDSPTKK